MKTLSIFRNVVMSRRNVKPEYTNIHDVLKYPLLTDLYSSDQIEKHGEKLALEHKIDRRPPVELLLANLEKNEKKLDEICCQLTKRDKNKIKHFPAGVWLLDNLYLIKEQVHLVRKHLSKKYSQELPRLRNSNSISLPRIFEIVRELIFHVDGRIDESNLRTIITAYQKVTYLKLGELWAVPIMVRLALIDNIVSIALRIETSFKERDIADIWAMRIIKTAESNPRNIVVDIADLSKENVKLNCAFVAGFVKNFHIHNPDLKFVLTWIDQRLIENGQSIERMIHIDSQQQAVSEISMSNNINSLRTVATIDWKGFVEAMSCVETILRKDPAGIYNRMDFTTRDACRHVVEELSKQSGLTEKKITECALLLATNSDTGKPSHIGEYLIDKKRTILEHAIGIKKTVKQILKHSLKKTMIILYPGTFLLITIILTVFALTVVPLKTGTVYWLMTCMIFIGVSNAALALVNWIASVYVKPRLLPRMDFASGIPLEFTTIVTVPTIISNENAITDLIDKMEVCYLSNKTENLFFSLLTDYIDADKEIMPDDVKYLEVVKTGIRQLNDRYGSEYCKPFLLFHRQRTFNPQEGCWMGYERKRGKIEALNLFLRSSSRTDFLVEGDFSVCSKVKYVITLDTDTDLPRDSARHMIETLAHPLNAPVYCEQKKRITKGYSILQPRVVSSLPAEESSLYSKFFSSDSGNDPYTRAVSDVYQDLFEEGSYIGKGIYDVDMFTKVLYQRLPENQILSHDLLEGTYCRAGLISDVQLIDAFPQRYSDDHSRRLRWIRGDWQIIQWIGFMVPGFDKHWVKNPLSVLSKCKLFDNIRRSTVPAAMLLMIVISWIFFTPSWIGLAMVIISLFIPLLPGMILKTVSIPHGYPIIYHFKSIIEYSGVQLFQLFFAIAVLPFEAVSSIDAILRTCWRMILSRRNLLQWTFSGNTKMESGIQIAGHLRLMLLSPFMSILLFSCMILLHLHIGIDMWCVLGIWFLSPVMSWVISRPLNRRNAKIDAGQVMYLRKIARKTWSYFETFANKDDCFLPVDNYQEEPVELIAHRTSPTNMGLMLLSSLAAHDLGHVTTGQLIDKITNTFKSMSIMLRFKGHFFNWYDTKTLQPLMPHYVSTVDSGNLTGYLLTLRIGLSELKSKPLFNYQSFCGLIDTLSVLKDASVSEISRSSTILQKIIDIEVMLRLAYEKKSGLFEILKTLCLIRESFNTLQNEIGKSDLKNPEIFRWLKSFDNDCSAIQNDLEFIAPWLQNELTELDSSSLAALDYNSNLYNLVNSCNQTIIDASQKDNHNNVLLEAVKSGCKRAQDRIAYLDLLEAQCREFADHEYDFLYDNQRNLLVIGYDVTNRRRDNGFYDLLASEARLGSFIGIASGKLPVEHWFRLGRLITIRKGKTMLISWGGSMFEYLMPQLVMPGYDATLLGQTCKAVVEWQIDYCQKLGVPWGISESAENLTDAGMNYQYRSFGVPGLGFKRDLADDLVITPYASALALSIYPLQACRNMERISKDGYEGRYGFYEAIDFEISKTLQIRNPVLIKSFMAHHQGMIYVSIANYLTGNRIPLRFESDPLFRTTTLLLKEKVPHVTPYKMQLAHEYVSDDPDNRQNDKPRVFTTPHTTVPEVHLLSNGRYYLMITASGGGYSRWLNFAVSRWNEDMTMDNCGTFIYINDLSTQHRWSATFQPMVIEPKKYQVTFLHSRAEFRRHDYGIDTFTEIAVSSEDDIEHRRITLSNYTGKSRTIELTSYFEVVLASPADDAAHPAFSNLFVQTEIQKNDNAILCSRRPRSEGEHCPWMFHMIIVRDLEKYEVSFETDRLAFIGRGRTTANPNVMEFGEQLGNTDGSVLDPIVSIRCKLVIGEDETLTVGFITGMAHTRLEAEILIQKYKDIQLADRVFNLAVIQGKVMQQQLNISENDAYLFDRLASSMIYANQYNRANQSILLRNDRGQSNLWAYGISGDLPVVLLRISDLSKMDFVKKMIQAHAYWHSKGLNADLVIWNEEQAGYRQLCNDQIISLITASHDVSLFDRSGGIHIRHPDQMPDSDQVLMLAVARMLFTDKSGTISEQYYKNFRNEPSIQKLCLTRYDRMTKLTDNFKQDDLLFFNGWGGFTHDGREYIIQMRRSHPTPMPWVNVVANKQFGTVISPNGGYTWFENAHEFRLTPWYNDPVTDRSGEAIYIRDDTSGLFWSATPGPAPGTNDYLNRHGFGYSVFEYIQNGIKSELWIYVDVEAPVKFWLIKIKNTSPVVRKISICNYVELVLGEHRSKTLMHIRTGIDSRTGALLASNPFNTDFAGRIVFFDVNSEQRSVSGDRTEFIGRNGSLANPAALYNERLSGRVGVGLDPAAALQVAFEIEPMQEKEYVFMMGAGRDIDDTRRLIGRFHGLQAAFDARDRVWDYWKQTLGTITIETPDRALNLLSNGWLVYQTLSSRLWARSGYYQSGGAYGFRDQLQDVMALKYSKPELMKEHLLLCASRQFTDGDVQHWWHPPQGRGVRTMISDDFLWLPLVASEYVTATGDNGILDEVVNFLEGRHLDQGEESYYDLPVKASQKDSLYEHCKRAIQHSLQYGKNGLPLMGSGDWNDSMNRVGIRKEGESVWLAFFLCYVLKKFKVIAHIRNDIAFEELCTTEIDKIQNAIDLNAWDGNWYRRAFFDDGTILGTSANDECKIDAVVQSWSVISGAGSGNRTVKAMESLAHLLIDKSHNLIKLLDPPFDKSVLEPGYIKGYVPGVRENGGQYTHAAIWAVMAYAIMGNRAMVRDLLSMINPVNHGSTLEQIQRYLVEPYVMAADVYAATSHTGRGGWTWYTGSASWMYQLVIEYVLGINLNCNTLTFTPCIPDEWKNFTIHYRFKETVYDLEFYQETPGGCVTVFINDSEQSENKVLLLNDLKSHLVKIMIR